MAYDINKVIKVAEEEIGYLEKKSNKSLDSKTLNAGSNNYTKYWRDMYPSFQGSAWCDCFVDWCFMTAYGKEAANKLLCGGCGVFYTPTSAQKFKDKGQWYKTPKVGDQIFFKNSTRICHTGIVYKVDSSKVYTIEGNTSGASGVVANGGGVKKKSYAIGSSYIAGYGRPNYGTQPTVAKTTTSTSTYTIKFPSRGYYTLGDGYKTNTGYTSYIKKIQTLVGATSDGEYGAKTEAAVKAWQKKKSLTADGDFGRKSATAAGWKY